MNGELWIQTRITAIFQHYILCVLTLITQKLQVVYRSSTYKMMLYYQRCPISVLEQDARYDWQAMVPNMHCCVFPISHLCTYMYK